MWPSRSQQALACLLPLALLLLASSVQGLAEGGRIPKPGSESGMEQSLRGIATSPSAETLQSIKDARMMTASALRNVLTAMAKVAGSHKRAAGDPSQWLALQPHVHRLVPYLKVHGPSEALNILRTLLRDDPSLETLLTRKKYLLDLARVFDPSAFLRWINRPSPDGMPMQADDTSNSSRRQKQASPKKPSKPKHSPSPKKAPRSPKHAASKKPHATTLKRGPIGNDPKDPVDQLYDWARRAKALGGDIRYLVQGEARRRSRSLLALDGDYEPDAAMAMPSDQVASQAATSRQLRSATKSAENVGFDWFKPRKIGVVFHMLQFRDKRNYLYPPQVYWNGDDPAKRLLEVINKMYRYSGTNVQFYLKDYRINVGMHPYLDMGNLTRWQDCGNLMTDCTCVLAKHNYQPHKYLNIFVAGSQAYRGFNNTNTAAITSASAGSIDLCQPYYNPEAGFSYNWDQKYSIKSQHVWMSFDYADPLQYNSAEFRNAGATTMGHEIGHILGLRHTFNPVNLFSSHLACEDGDFVPDTPPDDKDGAWRNGTLYDTLSSICRRIATTGQLPKREQLGRFDSCRGDAYIDNVFNFMNYVPTACRLLITRGQVRFMQKRITKHLKSLGDQW